MDIEIDKPEIRNLYDMVDGAFVPTALAVGPWDKRMQNGSVINALVAHLVEETPSPTPMVTTRVVTDLMKPARMAPVAGKVEIIREGSKLQLLQVELLQDNVPIVRASALRVRIADCPATSFAVHQLASEDLPSLSGKHSAMAPINMTRLIAGGIRELGPGIVWSRMAGDVVPGVPISPFVHAAMLADFGSGTSSYVSWREWSYANVDITLYLTRAPVGEWLRIDAATESAGNGIAVVDTRLADTQGEFGHAHQVLFMDRRA